MLFAIIALTHYSTDKYQKKAVVKVFNNVTILLVSSLILLEKALNWILHSTP